jgi:nucleoid-associated protein YgaU
MGNFEKLSVLVIVVIIVMILVVALYTWTDGSESSTPKAAEPLVATHDAAPSTTTTAADATRLSQPTPFRVGDLPKPSVVTTPATTNGTSTSQGSALPGSVDMRNPLDPLRSLTADKALDKPLDKSMDKPLETASVEPKSYEVVSGDNATKIAKKEMPGVSVVKALAAIEKANPGVDLNVLKIGQKLVIPAKPEDAAVSAKATVAVAKDAPKPALESLKPGSTYVTKKGDTLPTISKRTYGTADRWHEIWLANYAAIEDPSHVASGMRLKLPQ